MILREARHILAALAVAALGAIATGGRLPGQEPAVVREATREVFRSEDYEVDGRFETIVGETESPLRGRQPEEWRRRSSAPPDRKWEVNSGILEALMWIILGGALAFVLVWVIRALLAGPLPDSDRPDAAPKKIPSGARASAPPTPDWEPARLAEADAAAAQGDFGAAVHILWIATLDPIAKLMGRPLALAETSREILGEAPVKPEQRPPLEVLVGAVERSLFGGRKIGEPEYQRAREAFTTLTGPAPRSAG